MLGSALVRIAGGLLLVVIGTPARSVAQLVCGSAGDPAQDTQEILELFQAAKSVCTQQLGEMGAWDPGYLPLSCNTPACAQVIGAVNAACASTFVQSGFLSTAFKPALDPVVKLCAATATSGAIDGTVAAVADLDSSLDLSNVALPVYLTGDVTPGRTSVTFVAPAGQEVRVTAQVLYLSEGSSLRLFWNGAVGPNAPPSATLSGQSLPTAVHDRTLIGAGGEMRIEYLSTSPEPSFFRVAIDVVCYSTFACGEHGDCVSYGGEQWAGPMQTMEGRCVCHDGWTGNGCGTKQRAGAAGDLPGRDSVGHR